MPENGPYVDLTLAEFERRLLHTEGPLTDALDVLHGRHDWTEQDADHLADAILAAIERAQNDAR